MMILKFLEAVFILYIIIAVIVEMIGYIEKARKNARKNSMIPVRESARFSYTGNTGQRGRTSSVAVGQHVQRAGRQVPPDVPKQKYKNNRPKRQVTKNGPNGLRPSRFPCCPLCRARNFQGEAQVIFWNEQGFYTCRSGHKFKKNGALF